MVGKASRERERRYTQRGRTDREVGRKASTEGEVHTDRWTDRQR